METINNRAPVLVSENKWMKGKAVLARIREELSQRVKLCHKQLERDRGFLMYLSRAFKSMRPYLMGLHQTLDSWRRGRDEEGQKMDRQELKQFLAVYEGGSY